MLTSGCVPKAGIKPLGSDQFRITAFADGNHINTFFVEGVAAEAETYCKDLGKSFRRGPLDAHLRNSNDQNAYGVMEFKCLDENDPELINSQGITYPTRMVLPNIVQ